MTQKKGQRVEDRDTRDDILAAARDLFAQSGFRATTMRAVAARAGVDVALIPYYFRNKEGLFQAALELPVIPGEQVRERVRVPREELGRNLAEAFFAVWDSPDSGLALHGLMRSAVVDERMAPAFSEFVEAAGDPVRTHWPDLSADTANLLAALLIGVATLRYLVKSPSYTAQSTTDLVDAIAPRLQALIDAG